MSTRSNFGRWMFGVAAWLAAASAGIACSSLTGLDKFHEDPCFDAASCTDATSDASIVADGEAAAAQDSSTWLDTASELDTAPQQDTASEGVSVDSSSENDGAADGSPTDGSGDSTTADAADGSTSALNPKVAPGGNFDLSVWELEEPVGSPGAPAIIAPAQLVGSSGFQDSFFFTDPIDGAMTFWDPENGVSEPNVAYARSELREMTAAGAPASWALSGTNTLSATLKVTQVPDHVAVGQVRIAGAAAGVKLLQLFYYSSGSIVVVDGSTGSTSMVGTAPLGSTWNYTVTVTGSTTTTTVTVTGSPSRGFSVSQMFLQDSFYFSAGDFDQSAGTDGTVGAKVAFYALKVYHGP